MSGKQLILWRLGAALALFAAPAPVGAVDTLWNAGASNYNTATNWTPNSVPNYLLDERAVISNGGRALVSTATAADPAAVMLGLNAGQTGALDVASGGTLSVQFG